VREDRRVNNLKPTLQEPIEPVKPWRVVRYGLRSKSTVREFRRRWTAALYRRWRYLSLLDTYKVEPNPLRDADPVLADWLAEVLHVVWGFERREHEGIRTLVPAHASNALDAVPDHILQAARIDRSRR
jgi:hypothetical protein